MCLDFEYDHRLMSAGLLDIADIFTAGEVSPVLTYGGT